MRKPVRDRARCKIAVLGRPLTPPSCRLFVSG
jgi:hypothetical protein